MIKLLARILYYFRFHGIRYKNGHIMWIRYPRCCPWWKGELGDYCWGLAAETEKKKQKEFIKKNCPCEL